MSRTERTKPANERRFAIGRGRGIARAKAKMKRSIRHIQDAIARRHPDPVIEQGKKYKDFWWEWL